MYKKMYAVMDQQLGAFLNPFHCTNHGEAIRIFTGWVNPQEGQEKSNIALYPHQFTLYYIGDYDDKTGRFGIYDEEKNEYVHQNRVKELIIGSAVKLEAEQKFTVKQLITMLKAEIDNQNVIELTKQTLEN